MTRISRTNSRRRGEKIRDKGLVKLTLTVQFLSVCFRLFKIHVKNSLKNEWIMNWQSSLLTLSYSELFSHKGDVRNWRGSLKDQVIITIKQHRSFTLDKKNRKYEIEILAIKSWTPWSPLSLLLFAIILQLLESIFHYTCWSQPPSCKHSV